MPFTTISTKSDHFRG